MQTDLLKEAETILREGEDTKDYKILFILEPALVLNYSYKVPDIMKFYSKQKVKTQER